MRGHIGYDFQPFDSGPFGHFGPGFNHFGCGGHGRHRRHGTPGLDHCPFGRGRHGPGFFRPGPPGCYFENREPFFGRGPRGEDSDECCQDSCGFGGRGFTRGRWQPQDAEHGACGRSGCAEFEYGPRIEGRGRHRNPEGREQGPCHGPPHCGRPRDNSRDRSPHRCHRRKGQGSYHGPPHHGPGPHNGEERSHGRHGPCHGPPRHGSAPNDGEGRPQGREGPCHGPPGKGPDCGRRNHSRESGPGGPHGHNGPHYGQHFGHSGPHRNLFGPCNRRGPYDRCDERRSNSDDESGNETERRERRNKPCCSKNKNQNRDETVLVQRIVVEKAPRCSSV